MRGLLAAALLLSSAPSVAGETANNAPNGIEMLLIKDACTDILLTYGEGLDSRDPLKIWPLFTQNGVWSADGTVVVEGQAALREVWEGLAANPRPTTGRHAISNIRFKAVDSKTATGTALVTQHRYNPDKTDEITTLGAMMLVEINMQCVKTGDGWRFDRMDLQSISVAEYIHGEG